MARPLWSMPPSLSKEVDANNIVIDIGRAHDALKAILQPLNYKNLDDIPAFKGVNTTTEFLTRHIFDRLAEAARAGKLGRDGSELKAIRVTISESHVARASYEARFVVRRVVFAVPGDLDHADRRLCLRQAHHRRVARARLGRRRSRSRKQLSAAGCEGATGSE